MPIIIDGYNLLHATGIIGHGVGPGGLERSRLALLNVLAESIDSKEIPYTDVVFDASSAPAGLPRRANHKGLAVHYAVGHEDADSLIEELIERHSVPRRLVVVSSDHRLQRAARRRKARAVDSDRWYAELLQQRQRRSETKPGIATKPQAPPSEEEVRYWLQEFGQRATDEPSTTNNNYGFPPNYGEDLLDEDDEQANN